MNRRSIGIVMNGVTGRMGYRQHLVHSILAIRELWDTPGEETLRTVVERHRTHLAGIG